MLKGLFGDATKAVMELDATKAVMELDATKAVIKALDSKTAGIIEKGMGLKDNIYTFFNIKKEVIDNANTQIEEIKEFLTKETITKLDTFINNHKKVVEVIKALKGNKELDNDTNRRVECSYYKTYDDIGRNNITTSSLTLQEVEEIKGIQKGYCDKLFEENDEELQFIYKQTRTIDTNINLLLKNISENRNNAEIVSKLTPLRIKLQEYKGMIFEYIIPFKCGENGIKGLLSGKGGGSYKKTNKKNILGKERCIYKISGDRKEYIKYKGNFIAVREYKKLMKSR